MMPDERACLPMITRLRYRSVTAGKKLDRNILIVSRHPIPCSHSTPTGHHDGQAQTCSDTRTIWVKPSCSP